MPILKLLRLRKLPAIFITVIILLVTGCSSNKTAAVPSDFLFLMDVGSAGAGTAINISITIDTAGMAQYEYYDTGGVIQYDLSDKVTYNAEQVVKSGKFRLNNAELEQVWDSINENGFFDLTEDYRMALGSSYAFIMIEADGRKHMVDNVGMEVPEIRALVETIAALMPEGVDMEYGEGYVPGK